MKPASLPVIDLGGRAASVPPPSVVDRIAAAAETHGFFQVVEHGLPAGHIDDVWRATRRFFALDLDDKRRLMRSRENSRGYYERELTKNRRDLKEVIDLAEVPRPELPDDHPSNHHPVDGRNQWPDLAGFRDAVTTYLDSCRQLSLWLLSGFCLALGEPPRALHDAFAPASTSFLRMNHYPLEDLLSASEAAGVTDLGDMALHHHSDSGALTLLLQDDVGGLQVECDGTWVDVEPIPGAIVVNTGDMMQVWSNDRFRAALHRVRPMRGRARFSLPYFFNPSYDTDYEPLPGSIAAGDRAHYRRINWGDFRQGRADGDFADYGAEIQITDFRIP